MTRQFLFDFQQIAEHDRLIRVIHRNPCFLQQDR